MKTLLRCDHQSRTVGELSVASCSACGQVEWWGADRPLDPAAGMTRLFGQFDLVGRLPGLRAPGPEVLVYRPPGRRDHTALSAFPQGHWVEAAPDLWLSHDGSHLLLSPTDPLLLENLDRR